MLSKIVLVANLLMLAKGAIELPLSNVSHLSKNVLKLVSRRNRQPLSVLLYGGPRTPSYSYVAEITIGNQTYKVVPDTGSSQLAIINKDCVIWAGSVESNYGNYTGTNGTLYYGLSESNTCNRFAKFLTFIADVTMTGVQARGQYLAYIYEHTDNLFGSNPNMIQGVLGLEEKLMHQIHDVYGELANTFLATLSAQHGFANSFAMCFDPSGSGGRMIIGGGQLANMQFTSYIVDNFNTYTVKMSSISIKDRILPNTAVLRTLVDTGSPQIFLPTQVFEELASMLCPVLRTIGAHCSFNQQQKIYVHDTITVTPEQLGTLPSITFNFPGVTLVVSPKSYFMYLRPASSGKAHYSYAIKSNVGDCDTDVILGTVALVGRSVYFDNESNQVGFTSVENCNPQ